MDPPMVPRLKNEYEIRIKKKKISYLSLEFDKTDENNNIFVLPKDFR